MHKQNVIERHELIGLYGEIIESKNRYLKGIKGKIIDETKNTIKIFCDGKTKTIIKKQVKMKIINGSKEKIIEGSSIVKRPEDRLKK